MATEAPEIEQLVRSIPRLSTGRLNILFLAATIDSEFLQVSGIPDVTQNRYICNTSFLVKLLDAGANPMISLPLSATGLREMQSKARAFNHQTLPRGVKVDKAFFAKRQRERRNLGIPVAGRQGVALHSLWRNCPVETIRGVYRHSRLVPENDSMWTSGEELQPASTQYGELQRQQQAETRMLIHEGLTLRGTDRSFEERLVGGGLPAASARRPIQVESAILILRYYLSTVSETSRGRVDSILGKFLRATSSGPARNEALEQSIIALVDRGVPLHDESSLPWDIARYGGTVKMLEPLRRAKTCRFVLDRQRCDSGRGLSLAIMRSGSGGTLSDMALKHGNPALYKYLSGLGIAKTSVAERREERRWRREESIRREQRAMAIERKRLAFEEQVAREQAANQKVQEQASEAMRQAAIRKNATPTRDTPRPQIGSRPTAVPAKRLGTKASSATISTRTSSVATVNKKPECHAPPQYEQEQFEVSGNSGAWTKSSNDVSSQVHVCRLSERDAHRRGRAACKSAGLRWLGDTASTKSCNLEKRVTADCIARDREFTACVESQRQKSPEKSLVALQETCRVQKWVRRPCSDDARHEFRAKHSQVQVQCKAKKLPLHCD